jgi:hypothetical protein
MTSILVASLLCALPPQRSAPPAPDPSQAQPLSDEEIRQRIDTFMGSIDSPIPSAYWRALGARGAALLEGMAQDPNLLPSRRAKAVAGLSAIGAATSSAVLLSLARSPQVPLNVRLTAIHGVPGVVASSQVTAALQPMLENAENEHLRAAAAEVLSRHGGCGLVRAQARRERDTLAFHRALQICDNR